MTVGSDPCEGEGWAPSHAEAINAPNASEARMRPMRRIGRILASRLSVSRVVVLALAFGLWPLAFGLWALGSGLWALGFGPWAVGCGLWAVGFGLWAVASCDRRFVFGSSCERVFVCKPFFFQNGFKIEF